MDKKRGKLTIFLGIAPGVGKTVSMLSDALNSFKDEGIDTVLGWIEDCKNNKINHLKKELSLIPPVKFEHRNKFYYEMDLAALVNRKPQLAVIADLAHINAPGSCHVHRYQDVEDILQTGIDVYTTINIYQVESLNDIVNQITGISTSETVPDRVLENADYIKLIDITPEELIKRIKSRVVNISYHEKNALSKLGNINALRELALRYTAQKVDKKLNSYMQNNAIKDPWPAGERILACVGTSPFSANVIRTAKRMAAGLKAELLVAYVETPYNIINDAEQNQLSKNLRLAEDLGAEIINLTGNDVANEILNLARKKNISQIIIGKPLRFVFRNFFKGSVVNKIIKGSQGISVHVIPGKQKQNNSINKSKNIKETSSVLSYIGTLSFILVITIINKILEPSFDLINIALLYLLPVLFSAAYWGRGPSIMASLLGVLAFDIFFVPPQFSLTVADLKYLLSFVIFLLVAIITGTMATRLRNQVNLSMLREMRTAALYDLSRKIVAETDIEGILNAAVETIVDIINCEVIIYMVDSEKNLVIRKTNVLSKDNLSDTFELKTARWVFEHSQIAGKGTDTYNDSTALYMPLRSEEKNIGVVAVKPESIAQNFSPEQIRLLEAFANLTAVAITRFKLAEEAQQARYLKQSENLRVTLFNSISHEVRTPLSSILGAVTSLLEERELYSQKDQMILLQTINESALQMNRLFKNLLDMARLESGKLQLKWEWVDIQEVIGVALRSVHNIREHDLIINIAENLPLVKADFILIEQVLINLLNNAMKYSSSGSKIFIDVKKGEKEIELIVSDNGPQIPVEDRERIFNKFYRSYTQKETSGTGLGLSICKGIIEAHGGSIRLDSNSQDGNDFIFTIPI